MAKAPTKKTTDQSMCSPRKQAAMGLNAGGKVKGYAKGGMVDPAQAAAAMAAMMKKVQ